MVAPIVLSFLVRPAEPLSGHTSQLTIVAIIPARYRSTRFPGKPLADLAGAPMIEHVFRRASDATGVSRVIVATDDSRIADAVKAFGGEAVMTSPDHASGTDRLAEVARHLDCDVVVNVQGDEPLLAPAMIDEAVAPFRTNASEQMGTLRRPLLDRREWLDPNVVKVVVDHDDRALYFSRAPIPFGRSHEDGFVAGLASKHIGLYVYRRAFLLTLAALPPTPLERAEALEQLRALEHGYAIRAVPTAHDSIGVDTPADLDKVRQLLTAAPR
jgi:3-deoxy-manno-octulosonate cytidylyltransferase (CMP-KDO synthetase)